MKNAAFLFIKPHANTEATRSLVRQRLLEAGCDIVSENEITSKTIDRKKLIDKHYYAIGTRGECCTPFLLVLIAHFCASASKATLQSARDIPVPPKKFEEAFGEAWSTVLQENRACNAMEATDRLGCSVSELDEAWKAAKVVKFGGGFYCGRVTWNDMSLYVFNAFFLQMRSKFVEKNKSIHYFEIQWDPTAMSWKQFRSTFLGPTDPSEATKGSLRRAILDDYKTLGLESEPDKGDNGVHGSASPFEGFAERLNWLNRSIKDDDFGTALLSAGLAKKRIKEWSLDARIKLEDGSEGSVFDAIEDLDAEECIAKLVALNKLNGD